MLRILERLRQDHPAARSLVQRMRALTARSDRISDVEARTTQCHELLTDVAGKALFTTIQAFDEGPLAIAAFLGADGMVRRCDVVVIHHRSDGVALARHTAPLSITARALDALGAPAMSRARLTQHLMTALWMAPLVAYRARAGRLSVDGGAFALPTPSGLLRGRLVVDVTRDRDGPPAEHLPFYIEPNPAEPTAYAAIRCAVDEYVELSDSTRALHRELLGAAALNARVLEMHATACFTPIAWHPAAMRTMMSSPEARALAAWCDTMIERADWPRATAGAAATVH